METSIMDDLDADSLDAVEVMMALEDEFDIEYQMKMLRNSRI